MAEDFYDVSVMGSYAELHERGMGRRLRGGGPHRRRNIRSRLLRAPAIQRPARSATAGGGGSLAVDGVVAYGGGGGGARLRWLRE